MRITHVEAIPYNVPVQRVARFASGARERADHVLVRVHTDDGLVGQAEAQPRPYTYGETQESIVAAVGERLGPALAGLDPLATELVAERCSRLRRQQRRARRCRPRGLGPGRQDPRPTLPHTAWRVRARRGRGSHGLLRRAARDGRRGTRSTTSGSGSGRSRSRWGATSTLDLAAVAAIRDALPAAELYVDANRAGATTQALRTGDALIELGVRAIEEPIPVDDRDGRLPTGRCAGGCP